MQIVNGIYLPDRDKHFEAQILSNPIVDGKGTYQYNKLTAALELCKSREFAIDIGAQVGLWTRVLANEFERVAAIEPIPENVECLQLNVGKLVNVGIFGWAIGKWNGMLSLKYMEDVATASVCAYGDGDIEVPCKPLDDFEFEDVDFIKIDAEGYEKNIVESGENTIRKCKPVVFVEQKKRTTKYDGHRFGAIDILAKWGMKIAVESHGDYCMIWES
jgi:FkbM family methyltransferase